MLVLAPLENGDDDWALLRIIIMIIQYDGNHSTTLC
jgi:hypothetical protein